MWLPFLRSFPGNEAHKIFSEGPNGVFRVGGKKLMLKHFMRFFCPLYACICSTQHDLSPSRFWGRAKGTLSSESRFSDPCSACTSSMAYRFVSLLPVSLYRAGRRSETPRCPQNHVSMKLLSPPPSPKSWSKS